MSKSEFIAAQEDSGVRIDSAMAERLDGITRSYAKKLLDEGTVFVNGKSVRASYKLNEGDCITVDMPDAAPLDILPQEIPLDIVYEDAYLIVINKPAGMVVHPAAGNYDGTLVNALLSHCGDKLSAINGVIRPGIVHRIDKDTTGLLVVAKGDEAHLNLSEQLKSRTLKRKYYALVHGNITTDSGRIEEPIARSKTDRKKMTVTPEGREAATNYSVIERFGKYTFVSCLLDTGRTHQIRVHMRFLGHPIVGDKTYGIKKEEFNLSGQLLHAGEIGFVHPKTGEQMSFEAPLPASFEKILSILRKKV